MVRRCAMRSESLLPSALLVLMVASGGGLAPRLAIAVACEDFDDQCMVAGSGVCQPDGSCRGTPKADGTACDDGNSCSNSSTCQAGGCVGTSFKPAGTACTIPLLEKCLTAAQCTFFGACMPTDFVMCDDDGDGNECTMNICNPENGNCMHYVESCDGDCSSCNSETGECDGPPKSDDTDCSYNDCTGNYRCRSGLCQSSGEPVDTPTRTATSAVATATATTAAELTATPTRTPTPTATATVGTPAATPTLGPCIGDCGDDGEVTVDELVKGVNIALGTAELSGCPGFDTDDDGEVTVDELVKAVNAALNGCAAIGATPTETVTTVPTPTNTDHPEATATPTGTLPEGTPTNTPALTQTPTETPTRCPSATPCPPDTVKQCSDPEGCICACVAITATPTATGEVSPEPTATPTSPPSVARRAAGTVETTSTALLVIPKIISALLGHFSLSAGAATTFINLPFNCPAGGGGQLTCDQDIVGFPPSFTAPVYGVTLNNCAISTSTGATLLFGGTINATGQPGQSCFGFQSLDTLALSIPSLTVGAQGAAGSTTATFTNVSGTVELGGSDAECYYNVVSLQLTGTMEVVTKDAGGNTLNSTTAAFAGTTITITVDQYSNDGQCVPVLYSMLVEGGIEFTSGGTSFDATYDNFEIINDATSGVNQVEISGDVTSGCFGGTVTFLTSVPLNLTGETPCPEAGTVEVISTAGADQVRYTASGGVEVDLGADGTVDEQFPTCTDPRLYECPAS
ncbi:MAG: hypothetical protein HY699_14195 [Deltaproteobacteria bacterium]|nr:hypothetical protein [Deltaproteobacteria bacterium]